MPRVERLPPARLSVTLSRMVNSVAQSSRTSQLAGVLLCIMVRLTV